jgi:hypothetical protein
MNRRNIISLSAMAALGLAMLPTGAISQQKRSRSNWSELGH